MINMKRVFFLPYVIMLQSIYTTLTLSTTMHMRTFPTSVYFQSTLSVRIRMTLLISCYSFLLQGRFSVVRQHLQIDNFG